MRLIPSLGWSTGAGSRTLIDPRVLELLSRIDTQGSLRAACSAVGIPYRTAWGMLQAMEHSFGSPLVRLERGRGASLTADGMAWLRADEAARQRLSHELHAMTLEIGAPAGRTAAGMAPVLRLAASHDPALAILQDALPAAAGAKLNIEFCGSLDALARYRAGQVDIAGFHFVPGDPETARPFLSHLRTSRDRMLRFVDRDQGLIVAHGNPRHLTCLSDVVHRKLRFVNRQSGSGTRLLIDAQLAREGHAPRELRGYASEEFTHGAVAATIASGRADAGFGVAAAAAEYDLGFVPVVRERYYLVLREAMLRSAPVVALREALTGPIFRELVGHMPGYDATHAGKLERVDGNRRRPARAVK